MSTTIPTSELWFVGVYGQPVAKPTEIRKWEENTKFFKLLDKTYPRQKADRMLKDLSLIALTYSKLAVQQRLTFKPNPKGENSAPVVFQHDPNGELLEFVLDLRSLTPITVPPLSPIREEEDAVDGSKTFEVETKSDKTIRQQKGMIDTWVNDDDHAVTEQDRHPLELYAQLTDDEFLYVQELQRVYDESRCYFVQWILGKEIKELVNSARISAIQQGKKFTWSHTRLEILKSLTDVTLTARFLALARLKRKNGSTAKVWISQVLTRRALLEDSKLPTPITLPETLYLELTVGQMSAQKTTLFECPCIGDALNLRDHSGKLRWSLERLRATIDRCSNPPQFRGVRTPITELLEQEVTKALPPKNPNSNAQQDKEKKRLHQRTTEKAVTPNLKSVTKRPAHKLPASLPAGLKRPDLTATVDGKLIASEFQRQLFDDIKHGNCVRCHAKDHAQSTCKEPVGRWESKFDENKDKYWAGTLKWQQKAQAEKTGSTKATPPPTLVQQTKQSRRHHLAPRYPDEDDERLPLQCRAQLVKGSGYDEDPPPPRILPRASSSDHAGQRMQHLGQNKELFGKPSQNHQDTYFLVRIRK
jgi:hypothetical protein